MNVQMYVEFRMNVPALVVEMVRSEEAECVN